ncbi:MAG: lipid-A-disaccharide synthase N-terminal domain-containing protein [Acidobacteriota bacterium]
MKIEILWLIVGFVGQALFAGRFLVQWIASEMKKESIVPIYFWYLSVGGGAALFAYATYKLDPVFMVGQASGLIVYIRNLMLIQKKKG